MREEILAALEGIEAEESVEVLFACESGSRAWGFESVDSDWDVRLLYRHPIDWYLSIAEHRATIERMVPKDLDLAGWDLRKALTLLRKSNPSLHEWLRSPIMYRSHPRFMSEFVALADEYCDLARLFHHYMSMAQGNYARNLLGDEISYKKYLYVLRPLLACRWIVDQASAPPMKFEELRHLEVKDSLVGHALEDLLAIKRSSTELGAGPPIPALSQFIHGELQCLAEVAPKPTPAPPLEPLDVFFRKWIAT